jgi:protein-tyrosine kinase
MEQIRQAVERARAQRSSSTSPISENSDPNLRRAVCGFGSQGPTTVGLEYRVQETELNLKVLQAKRVFSYDGRDRRSRPYNMLRTQVLQSMDANGWKVLAVTSPAPRCGKTLTAINLAFSIARQPDRSVVLVDLDLQRPQLSSYLGLTPPDHGVVGVLEGRTSLRNIAVPIRAGDQRMVVIPTAVAKQSAEMMSSLPMGNLLRDLKANFQIVILDLPPILSSDDVIALLPQVDCILLVATMGVTKVSEVEECMRFLPPSRLARVVFNKAPEAESNYHYSYG